MRKFLVGFTVAVLGGGLLAVVPAPVVAEAPATRSAVIEMPAVPTVASAAVGAASAKDTEGQATPWPLSHLGVRWTGDAAAALEVRWATGGVWQPWQRVEANHDMTDATGGPVFSSLLRAPDANRVDVRVVSGQVADVAVIAIDTTHSRHAVVTARTQAAGASPSSTANPNPNARLTEPPIISRSEWGADESMRTGTPEFASISKLIIHHTDTQNDDPDPAATVRAIYAYHTQGNGWNDIGYNFLIDESGRIYEGRYARTYPAGQKPTGENEAGDGVVGAHALNANRGSVGVALLGTFDSRQPTDAAVNALEDLLGWEADHHSIDAFGATPYAMGDGTTRSFGNISGHRDSSSTDCPGDALYGMLPSIRQAVDARVSSAYGTTPGYWTATRTGDVLPFGKAVSYGSMTGRTLNAPIVGMAATPTGRGYWLLGGDGGIFTFGDAHFFGSTGAMKLNQPIVALQPTATGQGYWLVAKDGGIFTFGDALFWGSTGGMKLNKPVVGMAATPRGLGYWLVATDGGVFAFGDATFHGSTGAMKLNQPIMAMAATRKSGAGYWLTAKDGGVFAFDVPYRGSVPGLNLRSYAGSVGMQATQSSGGYYILGADGGIFTFGDANFLGAKAGVAAAAIALMRDPTVPPPT